MAVFCILTFPQHFVCFFLLSPTYVFPRSGDEYFMCFPSGLNLFLREKHSLAHIPWELNTLASFKHTLLGVIKKYIYG